MGQNISADRAITQIIGMYGMEIVFCVDNMFDIHNFFRFGSKADLKLPMKYDMISLF